MKLYAISGLGADQRVYQYLNIDYELIHLDWIRPIKNEGITDYTMRLSQGINTSEPFGIIGLSFGGLVAIEMSKEAVINGMESKISKDDAMYQDYKRSEMRKILDAEL